MELSQVLRQRFFDSNGDPLAGGKLYSYEAGTTTPLATYTDQSGSTANTNPIILDASGEADVWVDAAVAYKFVLHDSSDVEQWTTDNVGGASGSGSLNSDNMSIVASVLSNQLTVEMKQIDGTLDPTESSSSIVEMRNPVLTSGVPVSVSFVSATALTVPVGATLGGKNGVEQHKYVYAIYDGTNKEIAISENYKLDEGVLHNTTALSAASDDGSILYSNTARVNCSIRLISRITSTQTTAGTWATAPSAISKEPFFETEPNIQTLLNSGGEVINIGLSLSSGVLKLVQADGSDFNSSNPGYLLMPSTTDGQKKVLKVTSTTHLFEDSSGSSDIVGEEFDTRTGVAWTDDRPFFLYAVNTDDTDSGVYFAISPNPVLKQTPTNSARIGYHGNPMSSPIIPGMFFLTSTDVTSQTSKPCKRIGCFRMTKNVSDDWLVTTIDVSKGDGITPEAYPNMFFEVPDGIYNASSKFYVDSGTVPAATIRKFSYGIKPDGAVFMSYTFSISAAGSAAANLFLTMPYRDGALDDYGQFLPGGRLVIGGVSEQLNIFRSTNALFQVLRASYSGVLANGFSASDSIDGDFVYYPFAEVV